MDNIMEILDKMQFFGGQRAGRELWEDKPKDVQDADIEVFNKNVDAIRGYIRQLEAELRDAEANHQHTIDVAEKQKEQIGKLKAVIARMNKERTTRWISVEERVPKRGITKCVACVKVGDGLTRVVCASYNADLKLWTGWYGEAIRNKVTHWMPLPEPPKEEQS